MGRRLPVYPYGLWYACYMGNCHIYQLLFTQKKQDRYRDFLYSVVGGHYDLHKPYIFENPIYVGVILMIDLQKAQKNSQPLVERGARPSSQNALAIAPIPEPALYFYYSNTPNIYDDSFR